MVSSTVKKTNVNIIKLLENFYSLNSDRLRELFTLKTKDKSKEQYNVNDIRGAFPRWFFERDFINKPVVGYAENDNFLLILASEGNSIQAGCITLKFTRNTAFPVVDLAVKDRQVEHRHFFIHPAEYFIKFLDAVFEDQSSIWRVYYNPSLSTQNFEEVRKWPFGKNWFVVQRRWFFVKGLYIAANKPPINNIIELDEDFFSSKRLKNQYLWNDGEYNVLIRHRFSASYKLVEHTTTWEHSFDTDVEKIRKVCLTKENKNFGVAECFVADEEGNFGAELIVKKRKTIVKIADEFTYKPLKTPMLVVSFVRDIEPLSPAERERLELTLLANEL